VQSSGVLVLDVTDGGPAAGAGVERGDVIVALDGEPIAGVDDLHRSLSEEKVGRALTLTLLRRAAIVSLSATPGEA
jgi:S1-C subfamily serine protease